MRHPQLRAVHKVKLVYTKPSRIYTMTHGPVEKQIFGVLSKYFHIHSFDFSAKFSVSVGTRCVSVWVRVCLLGVLEKLKSNCYIAIYLSKSHPHDCVH